MFWPPPLPDVGLSLDFSFDLLSWVFSSPFLFSSMEANSFSSSSVREYPMKLGSRGSLFTWKSSSSSWVSRAHEGVYNSAIVSVLFQRSLSLSLRGMESHA